MYTDPIAACIEDSDFNYDELTTQNYGTKQRRIRRDKTSKVESKDGFGMVMPERS